MADTKSKTVPSGLMGTGSKVDEKTAAGQKLENELGGANAASGKANQVGTDDQRTTVNLRGEYSGS